MSSPDIELLSTKRISRPHLGHFVSDAFDAGVRREFTLIQEGNFIGGSPDTIAELLRPPVVIHNVLRDRAGLLPA